MACKEQIEQYVNDIMEARNKMREAENPKLSRLARITLLQEATDLIHKAIKEVGFVKSLTNLRDECYDQFMEACK